ncbi:hypothetical protein ACFLVC_00860 [Chloroflexota bacterium]
MKRLLSICLAIVIAFSYNFVAITPAHASNDLEWTWANPYPIGNELTSITYGNGMFVANGADGTIITSTDGETWDIQNSGTSNHLDGAAWLDNKFWCVGSGVMLNSTDGVNWTNPNTGPSFTGYNISYNGSRYVIPSSSSVRYSDDDGATWNLINLGVILGWPEYRMMYDIVWDGSQFVVIGDYGTVVTSPDGETWTEQTSPVTAPLKAIVYDGSTFVAIGNSGAIITSPNGTSWTQRTSGTVSQLLDITSDGSQFVAVGNPSSAGENITVLTSSDGINWAKHNDDFRASFAGVAWNGTDTFAAVGFGGTIAVSSDGADWDKISHGTIQNLYDVTWNGNQYVTVGMHGTIVTSPDGVNWTDHSLTMANIGSLTLIPDLKAVTWGNDQFVAMGNWIVVTSPDGVTWTSQWASPVINFRDVIWAGDPLNLFVAAGPGNKVSTSADGVTWTEQSFGLSSNQRVDSLAWNSSKLVAAGGGLSLSDRFVATSEDTISWNINSLTSQFRDIIWDGSRFMAVESGMTIYASPDGDTWTLAVTSLPSASLLNGLVWDGSQYTAVGRVVLHSSDGSTWSVQPMITDNELSAIMWNGDSQYVAVGEHGTILVAGEPFYALAEVQGYKWEDLNGNREWDEGEPAMSGVTIYADLNQDDMLEEGEPSVVTDENGWYSITELPTRVDFRVSEIVPENYLQTFPEVLGYWGVNLSPGQVLTDINFGNRIAKITVQIDIKPGSDPNSINLKSNGVIPVAVLTDESFFSASINTTTVLFGRTGYEAEPAHYSFEDVDDDGDTDMILHFRTQDTGIEPNDTEATLTGLTTDGIEITGTDSVRIVPPIKKPKPVKSTNPGKGRGQDNGNSNPNRGPGNNQGSGNDNFNSRQGNNQGGGNGDSNPGQGKVKGKGKK